MPKYGSPPPARGAPLPGCRPSHSWWITPACAGSTLCRGPRCPHAPDHPRLRGEHRRMPVDPSPVQGSPPPARGALALQARRHAEIRITPACAGSTSSRLSAKSLMVDHPRLRGEHAVSWTSMPTCTGSPPPARGAPLQLLDYRVDLRITPACAGSTVGCR